MRHKAKKGKRRCPHNGKVCFDTEVAAEKQQKIAMIGYALKVRELEPNKTGAIKIYRCPHCLAFHLTSEKITTNVDFYVGPES